MSKFDLRDVSKRLSESRDTEAVVYEFLGYLQSLRPDWRASLAFYEVSRDTLTSLYARDGEELVRRDLLVAVEQLPPRLVRKFFHAGAFSDTGNRRSLLASLFKNRAVLRARGVRRPGAAPAGRDPGLGVVHLHAARGPGRISSPCW